MEAMQAPDLRPQRGELVKHIQYVRVEIRRK